MGITKSDSLKQRNPDEVLTIDEEFKNLNPLKSKISNMFLERELQEKGFDSLHPIVIWVHNGKEIIVDGYNRYSLTKKLGISYYTVEKEFEDRKEVREWIKNNQDSHRSLSPLVERYKLGAYYNSLKQRQGGDKKSKDKSKPEVPVFKSTAHQLAEELGVDHSTIDTAGRHAKTVDEYVKNTHRRYYEIINLIEKDKNVSFRSFDIIAQVKSEAQEDFVNKLETETEVSLREFVKQFPTKPDLKKPKEKKDKAPVQGTKKIDNPPVKSKIDSAPIIETEVSTEPVKAQDAPVEPEVPIIVSAPVSEPVEEPIVESGVIIPEVIQMNVVRVKPDFFKQSEDGKLQLDISFNGECFSCFAYQVDEFTLSLQYPNIENLIFDFEDTFGIATPPILKANPKYDGCNHDAYVPVKTWNNVVGERFPDLKLEIPPQVKPASLIQEIAQSTEKLTTNRDYTRDKQLIPELVKKAGTRGITKKEIMIATGRREDYDSADYNGKKNIGWAYHNICEKLEKDNVLRIEGEGNHIRYFAKNDSTRS